MDFSCKDYLVRCIRREDLFFEPYPIMPTRISINPYRHVAYHEIIGGAGTAYPCSVVARCFDDLYDHELFVDNDHHAAMDALTNHMWRGILPGDTRFYSPYSGEYVYFLELVDDVMSMYEMAVNFFDLTDSEEENVEPEAVINLYDRPFPRNIGAFRLIPGFDVMNDATWDTDTTLNTTQTSGEDSMEQ
ncbi:MAG: hypothetical protein [Avonheates virus Gas_102]|nr:MAG: hypothetical protein [Avonheates virus Gas_102]